MMGLFPGPSARPEVAMRVASLLALLLLALPVAGREPDFEAAARGAERLDGLEAFLARYVGHCTDPYERQRCQANVAQIRKAAAGKSFTVRVTDAAGLVHPERKGGGYVVLLTPFVDGGGLALTNGAPTRQDAAGRPIVNLVPIPGTVPDGMMDMEWESPFRTGAIDLEIVFRPEKVWKLARRGEPGSYEGVAARFVAVRILDARTGSLIAAKVL
jgi:hypothetical protein